MSSIEKKPGQQPLTIGNTTPPGDTHVDATVEIFTVHIFFDGTGNNRFNTASHREHPENSPKGSVSYENYYSNIALLFMAMQESDTVKKLYAEGSGTTRDQADDNFGLGLAMGSSGRISRVNELISRLNTLVGKRNRSNVVLNVYGFSRGAAWARYFCYALMTPSAEIQRNLKNDGLSKDHEQWKQAKINFVGIFDTVSSDGFEHYNDVEEMGLDIGKDQRINYIAHLTAQNDYRNHFPMTPIRRALEDGIGFECSFPGAHSDLGGGYGEVAKENDIFLGIEGRGMHEQGDGYIDVNWFIQKGYYRLDQISKRKVPNPDYGFSIALYANRTTYYLYQFITANVMGELANLKADYIELDGTDYQRGIESMRKVEILKRFHAGALAYVMENYLKKGGNYQAPLLADEAEMRAIYNSYIHNSLKYGDLANGGTILSKEFNKTDHFYDYTHPVRPLVTKGVS